MTTKYLIAYGVTAVVLVALDMVWLRVIAIDWYQQGMGHLMAEQPKLAAAALFYVMFPLGLVIFAVAPQLDVDGAWRTAVLGALFGFFAYATYDLTNLAVLRNWPIGLSVIDIAWGAVVSALASSAGRAAASAM